MTRRTFSRVAIFATLFLVIISILISAIHRVDHNRTYEWAGSMAVSNLKDIRSVETAYFAEWGVWFGNASLPAIGTSSFYPGSRDYMRTPEPFSASRFSLLGYAPDNPDYYNYEIEGSDQIPEADGFKAHAYADLDNDGKKSIFTITNKSPQVTHDGDVDEDGRWWTFTLRGTTLIKK